MRRPAGWLAAALACALAAPLAAQSHLLPADERDGYRQTLRTVFLEGRDADTLLQAIIIPNYPPERSVSIRRDRARFEVVVLTPRQHIWRYTLADMYLGGQVRRIDIPPEERNAAAASEAEEILDGLPDDPRDVRIDSCTRPVPRRTTIALAEAWETTLRETRERDDEDQNDRIVLHGTSYVFWMPDPARPNYIPGTEGEIYAPYRGHPAVLAEIASGLVDYCEGRKSESSLRRLAEDITRTEDQRE